MNGVHRKHAAGWFDNLVAYLDSWGTGSYPFGFAITLAHFLLLLIKSYTLFAYRSPVWRSYQSMQMPTWTSYFLHIKWFAFSSLALLEEPKFSLFLLKGCVIFEHLGREWSTTLHGRLQLAGQKPAGGAGLLGVAGKCRRVAKSASPNLFTYSG